MFLIKKLIVTLLMYHLKLLCGLVRFQPPHEEQQHRQPSGEGQRGSARPRLRPPRGGAAQQAAAALQHGGTRLRTGGAPAQHTQNVATTLSESSAGALQLS